MIKKEDNEQLTTLKYLTQIPINLYCLAQQHQKKAP